MTEIICERIPKILLHVAAVIIGSTSAVKVG